MSFILGALGALFVGAVVIVVAGVCMIMLAGVCINAWADFITGGIFKE